MVCIDVLQCNEPLYHTICTSNSYNIPALSNIVHSRFLDGNAVWRLERLATATGMTTEGVLAMGPAYIKGILKPLGE